MITPRLAVLFMRNNVELSDEHWKEVESLDPMSVARAMMDSGTVNGRELQFLHELAKVQSGKDYDKDISDCGVWDDDTLRGYAEFIKNSHYKYKTEAVQIDSDIDPNEEHIGPMAQEIEKVNPACIEETPQGVKTVDTSRLALMNAGAIGDLARKSYQQDELIRKIAEKVGAA
jgi:hypothetical protein